MQCGQFGLNLRRIVTVATFLACAGGLGFAQRPQGSGMDIQNTFTPSGWMGDGEYGQTYIAFSGANPIKITYRFGPQRWGGFYWQNVPDNWGDKPGTDYSAKGFSKVTFWAKGEIGNEVVEFKVGGVDNAAKPYRDSFAATLGRVKLTQGWMPYTIDLSGKNLNSVIGGFCWVAAANYNDAKQIVFYLRDITMQ